MSKEFGGGVEVIMPRSQEIKKWAISPVPVTEQESGKPQQHLLQSFRFGALGLECPPLVLLSGLEGKQQPQNLSHSKSVPKAHITEHTEPLGQMTKYLLYIMHEERVPRQPWG